jgi:hypothetical protein
MCTFGSQQNIVLKACECIKSGHTFGRRAVNNAHNNVLYFGFVLQTATFTLQDIKKKKRDYIAIKLKRKSIDLDKCNINIPLRF